MSPDTVKCLWGKGTGVGAKLPLTEIPWAKYFVCWYLPFLIVYKMDPESCSHFLDMNIDLALLWPGHSQAWSDRYSLLETFFGNCHVQVEISLSVWTLHKLVRWTRKWSLKNCSRFRAKTKGFFTTRSSNVSVQHDPFPTCPVLFLLKPM